MTQELLQLIATIVDAALGGTAIVLCVRLDKRIRRVARRLGIVEKRATPPAGIPIVRAPTSSD